MNLDKARFNMVEQQIRPWDVLDPIILDLFMDTPRHLFVTKKQQMLAYSDIELPLDDTQSMLAPKVEARLLQAADIATTENVLEIGTGSGFMTALMSQLAKSVTTVEISETLLAQAKNNLHAFDNINFVLADGASGLDDNQQYDVIIIGGATTNLPEAYKTKLTVGGRIIATTGYAPTMDSTLFTRVADNEWETEVLFETVMPSLINGKTATPFQL